MKSTRRSFLKKSGTLSAAAVYGFELCSMHLVNANVFSEGFSVDWDAFEKAENPCTKEKVDDPCKAGNEQMWVWACKVNGQQFYCGLITQQDVNDPNKKAGRGDRNCVWGPNPTCAGAGNNTIACKIPNTALAAVCHNVQGAAQGTISCDSLLSVT